MLPTNVPVIGLTGGIGSGKSTVAHLFAEIGIPLVDTDLIAHALTGPGGLAMPAIAAAFGQEVVAADGRLDRAIMRQRVFADPAERQRLEAILHPLIRQQSDEAVAVAQASGAPYVLLVVPLLVENERYRQRCKRILVVDCPEETQIARVMARNGLSREAVEAIMSAQASRSERLAAAQDVVDNSRGTESLPAQVMALHQQYLMLKEGECA